VLEQLAYQDWIFAIPFVMACHAYSMGIQWCRSARFGGIAFWSLEAAARYRRARGRSDDHPCGKEVARLVLAKEHINREESRAAVKRIRDRAE
jgi:hypothetical protein